MAVTTHISAFGISRELMRVACKERSIEMVKYYLSSSMFPISKHHIHTKPSTAEIRNLTQSIGVKLGFFFSGYIISNNIRHTMRGNK
jgi:hypothetical protein